MATNYKYTNFSKFPESTKSIDSTDIKFVGFDANEQSEVLIDCGTTVQSSINLMNDAYNAIKTLTSEAFSGTLIVPIYDSTGENIIPGYYAKLKLCLTTGDVPNENASNVTLKVFKQEQINNFTR